MPLEENGKFHPFEYASGESFVADQGESNRRDQKKYCRFHKEVLKGVEI